MEPVVAYIGIGSNLGDRSAACREALRRLEALSATGRVRAAPLYETEPVGPIAQGLFLNTVAEVTTRLAPQTLFEHCLGIERALGRIRPDRIPYGPRTIDLDLLLYGAVRLTLPDLTVPHPRLAERRFVLAPLAELAPDVVHPVLGRTIRSLLDALPDAHHGDIRPVASFPWGDTQPV